MVVGERLLAGAGRAYSAVDGSPRVVAAVMAAGIAAGAAAWLAGEHGLASLIWTQAWPWLPWPSGWSASCSAGNLAST